MMSISENWTKSKRSRIQGRKAHYFSAEYLIGRLVYSNLYNLGILDELKKTFLEVGVDLACMEDIEDAALGNGGLGLLVLLILLVDRSGHGEYVYVADTAPVNGVRNFHGRLIISLG